MDLWTVLLVAGIAAALLFTLTNGISDASSVVATFISCGAATPGQAIILASICSLLGSLLGGSAVANTVAKIISLPADLQLLPVLLAAMTGAILWNLIAWSWGLPFSATHALVGGLVGSGWVAAGAETVNWGVAALLHRGALTGVTAVVLALIFSPLLGFGAAWLLQRLAAMLLYRAPFRINRWLKRLQFALVALLAFSHGSNDTQKAVGVITLALVAAGSLPSFSPPLWVKLACGVMMFIGILSGGWSIMKTLGRGIFALRPIHSLNSQLAAGGAVFAATMLGAPVSTTQVVAGSVVGVGAADNYKMVNWQVGHRMLLAWGVTIPDSAAIAAIAYLLLELIL